MNPTKSTKAAVLTKLGEPLEILELQLPPLERGQVLVDVAYSGVCHTQVLEVRGKRGDDPYIPHTLGHEASGTVAEVGPGVEKVDPGDRVAITWMEAEGLEVASSTFDSPIGEVNSGAVSTFMETTVTCENRVVPLPEGMPLREASLLGCAVCTGVGSVRNNVQPDIGEAGVVFGVGGIGSCAIMGASLSGSDPLIAVDLHDEKLRLADDLGATHTINAAREDPLEVIRDITEGEGVDFAIEATGEPQVMSTAHCSVRANGGVCVIVGNPPQGDRFPVDPFDLIEGRQLRGTWGGESSPETDIPQYADLYIEGELSLDRLISKEFALAEINRAIDDFESGEVLRPLVRMT